MARATWCPQRRGDSAGGRQAVSRTCHQRAHHTGTQLHRGAFLSPQTERAGRPAARATGQWQAERTLILASAPVRCDPSNTENRTVSYVTSFRRWKSGSVDGDSLGNTFQRRISESGPLQKSPDTIVTLPEYQLSEYCALHAGSFQTMFAYSGRSPNDAYRGQLTNNVHLRRPLIRRCSLTAASHQATCLWRPLKKQR